MLSWYKIINEHVKQQLDTFNFTPTLRTMHYRLYSMGVIHNTKSCYNTLSNRTARAREDGTLPINCFSDDTRNVVGNFPNDSDYEEPEEHVEDLIDALKGFPQYYKDRVSRWRNQEHHVELWTEKKTMIRTFESILGNRQVLIVPFGGYTSVTYAYDNCMRIKRLHESGKKMHILYFGDMDPSGEDIQRDVHQKLNWYGEMSDLRNNVDFKRIALTEGQIRQFRLPISVDAETLTKLRRDTRSRGFKLDHNGELFQVEVDALTAYAATEFEKMVQGAVDQYFENDIYQEMLKEHSPEQLNKLVKSRVKFKGE
jgi:hypothetical protein